MGYLVTIDPGENTGVAEWRITSVSSGYQEATRYEGELLKAYKTPGTYLRADKFPGAICLIEKPNIRGRHGTDNPNAILELAIKVGELKREFANAGFTVQLVPVNMWKKSVPKKIHNNRVLQLLSSQEKAILEPNRAGNYDHNMVDAIGIGLWFLKRKKEA